MESERRPLIPRQERHFEISNQASDLSFACLSRSTHVPRDNTLDEDCQASKGTTVFQTALNITKLCMGTGTLALPFAAQKGGLVFNMVGLGVIVVWIYCSADCLLRCLDYLPRKTVDQSSKECNDILCSMKQAGDRELHGAIHARDVDRTEDASHTGSYLPPEGTTTYGAVAWHAYGRSGLIALELLMILLFVGLLIAYQVAMFSFIDGIIGNRGSRGYYKVFPSLAVALLSCAQDISFLSKFSVLGLLALALSFGVISWEGLKENGWNGFSDVMELNLWPESLSAASSWFGVVVFGYGVVPFIFTFRDSMAKPSWIGLSTKIGLTIAYVFYLFASNGIRILFLHTHSFDGDVLQALPDSPVSLVVRLLMIFVVTVTAPLVAVPCGEMIEGKLGIRSIDLIYKRVIIRGLLCVICTLLAAFVPGFVNIISFLGCFCVSMTGFVLPPIFCLRLTNSAHPGVFDVGLLLVGLITTAVTSAMTFHDLMTYSKL
ncbi:hypothetical protein ACHAW6_014500 [Cyclotella cf. meneghiniana]